ncbi:glucan biosynthesis protein D [Pelagibius sp. CAU 1746]|uniref:glucan biosynthesis protein n=1 Tax=Pelagibius sp. CAU 1746 TaxID=3140370 RepID=UPI00325B98B1
MPRPFSRRRLLELATLGAACGAAGPALLGPLEAWAQSTAGLRFGPARPFSFEALTGRAKEAAAGPYRPPYRPAPEVVEQIDYEAHGKIRFDPGRALYGPGASGPQSAYPATFFHLGRFFGKSVKMHDLRDSAGGMAAREILYAPDYFEMPPDSVARELPEDSGFAGFRLQESTGRDDWRTHDWIAFLGASYFRAIGELEQYGLSARGVVVNPTLSGPEEFPDFTEFYIAPAARPGDAVAVYALLDGPSLTGAFRFSLTRNAGVTMDVEKHLFLRRDVARLGLAPLTSMYWYAEGDRPARVDWRPEIHDSDGLALWTGKGERLWRPLNNPQRVTLSSFFDDDPRGFGLLQRDRDFDHYLDGVRYERRPSLWVEPLGDWGPGSVQLLEIPTDDEIHDNIVACWVPQAAARAGDSRHLTYRLHWLAEEPYPARDFARVTASRLGRGGQPGKPRPPGLTKFVVDFDGGRLPGLSAGSEPEPVVTASRGNVSRSFAEPVPGSDTWRAVFDLELDYGGIGSEEPVELRMYLALGDQPLSETWLYQYRPDREPPS